MWRLLITPCAASTRWIFSSKTSAAQGKPLTLTIIRGGARRKIPVSPVKRQEGAEGEKPLYLLGLCVEDPAAGVGTLTYFRPETGRFGGLGHRVLRFGNRPLPLGQGKIVAARITGINQGNRGEPGEKIGIFSGREDVIGDIRANTELGIFGILKRELKNPYYPLAIPVATTFEVTTGPAEIVTVISGREIRRFTIEIQRVYRQKTLRDKGLVIRVTDPVPPRRSRRDRPRDEREPDYSKWEDGRCGDPRFCERPDPRVWRLRRMDAANGRDGLGRGEKAS